MANSEPTHQQSFISACAALDIRLPDEFHDDLLGMSDDETYLWLVENCGLAVGLDEWLEKRFGAYFSQIQDVEPFQDAINLWRHLEKLGVAQATVSNSDRLIVQSNLSRLGLDRPGLVSVARNEVRKGKPDPESYLRAAHLLGVDPCDCAVVEDSATGAKAGHAAGMSVYVMPWFESDGCANFDNFETLVEHVQFFSGEGRD